MTVEMSCHALRRSRQRSVPAFVVDLLEEFGAAERCGGAERLFFNRTARERLRARIVAKQEVCRIERYLNCYAVVGDNGRVVTVGWRTKRLKRP
jgi:hypothetical protein